MKNWKAGVIHDDYVIRTVLCPLCGEKTRTTFPTNGRIMRTASSVQDCQAEAYEWTFRPLAWIETACLACGGRIHLGTWMPGTRKKEGTEECQVLR